MAFLVPGSPGVHPPFSPTCFAQGLPAGALLRLAKPGRPDPMGAHPCAAGLDRGSPPASNFQTRTALSTVRRAFALDRHPDPWASLNPDPMPCCYHHHRLSSGVRLKTRENASVRIL